MITAIIAFIVSLLLLVVAHERGHFILARKAGVTVHEFSIGMGPLVYSFGKDRHGTVFNLRAFPVGGYVRIKGESPHEFGALNQHDSFIRASFRRKVAILLGGIVMNVIVARAIFTFGFRRGVTPIQVLPDNALKHESRSYLMPSHSFLVSKGLLDERTAQTPVVIKDMSDSGLGSTIGLRVGDVVSSIAGNPVTTATIQRILQEQIGKTVPLFFTRNGEQEQVTLICPTDSCVLGIAMDGTSAYKPPVIRFSLPIAAIIAAREIREQTTMTLHGLQGLVGRLFTSHRGEVVQKLSGPVGAARVGQFVLANGGWTEFMVFAGMLSLALAIFNILPIPALDGGRLLGVIVQKIGRFKEAKYFEIEGMINTVCFVLLLVLGVRIMLQDLVKAWGVSIPGIG